MSGLQRKFQRQIQALVNPLFGVKKDDPNKTKKQGNKRRRLESNFLRKPEKITTYEILTNDFEEVEKAYLEQKEMDKNDKIAHNHLKALEKIHVKKPKNSAKKKIKKERMKTAYENYIAEKEANRNKVYGINPFIPKFRQSGGMSQSLFDMYGFGNEDVSMSTDYSEVSK